MCSEWERIDARLRLAMVSGLGPVLTRRIEEHFGDPVAACEASGRELQRIEGIGRQRAELIRRALDEADVEAERERMAELGVEAVTIEDERYPTGLRHIADPPPLLYVRGKFQHHDALALAIVGSRRCTHYGREQADRLAALCSQAGLTIVSGGARGIDVAAHRAALRVGGRTIAVMGSGLADPYPAEHGELYDRIAAEGGAVVSELPMTTPPTAKNFPSRNRIISGLSLGVLIVEAATRSGALITARLAAEEHHREVLALPGRVDSAASSGCHKIIREGWATLVTGPADVLDALGEAGQTLKAAMSADETGRRRGAAEGADEDDGRSEVGSDGVEAEDGAGGGGDGGDEASRVLEAIGREATSIDAVCRETGLAMSAIQAHLTQLQITGRVERLPGGNVRRRN